MAHEYRTIKPWQWENPGDVRLVAKAEGYCMVRRKGAMPFVIAAKIWDEAPVARLSHPIKANGGCNE